MKYLVVFLIVAALPLNSLVFSQVLDSLYLPTLEASPGDTVIATLYLSNHSFTVGGFKLKISLADTSLAKFGNIIRGSDVDYFSYYSANITADGSLVIMGIANLPPAHNGPLPIALHEIATLEIFIGDSAPVPSEVSVYFYTGEDMLNVIADVTGFEVLRPTLINGSIVINSANSIAEPQPLPQGFELFDNYPNPFNSHTIIEFSVSSPGYASITIYDTQGRKVKELLSGHYDAGRYQAVWDGRSFDGQTVSSGVYYYTLKYNEFMSTGKMSYLK